MVTRRIVYVLALVGSIVFHALYPYWFSWYLMTLIPMLAPFDFLVSIAGMLTKRVSLAVPKLLDKGAGGAAVLATYQNRPYPTGRIRAKLTIDAGGSAITRRITCSAERGGSVEIPIDTLHSGLTVFDIRRIRTTSLVGLFSIYVPVRLRAAVLILPAPVKPPRIVSLPRGVVLRPKRGGGFSEDHDMRQYRHGDPIRSVHWKLSAKHDELIVREPLAPPPQSRLVRIAPWNGADERDLILGRLMWISGYLLNRDMPYYIKLWDGSPIAEITRPEDLSEFLYNSLDSQAPPIPAPVSLPDRFSWVYNIDARAQGEEAV